MRVASIVLNSIIVVVMVVVYITYFRKEGKWAAKNGLRPLKYFTFLSNVFCAVGALLIIIFPTVYPIWIIKYMGIVSVTLTMMTVLVFLGPALGYKRVLTKQDFWLHLWNPVLAIVSFVVCERTTLAAWNRLMPRNVFGIPQALLGMVPMALYGLLYGYKVLLAPEAKRWEDFYGFNKGGKWYISVCLMVLGTGAICAVFWAVMHFLAV
jgi:hypothetical protein